MRILNELVNFLVRRRITLFAAQLVFLIVLFYAFGLPKYNGNLDGLESTENSEFQKLQEVDSIFRNSKVFYFILSPRTNERRTVFKAIAELEDKVILSYPDAKFITPVPFYRKMIRYFGKESENLDVFISKADSVPLLRQLISEDRKSFLCLMSVSEGYEIDVSSIDSITMALSDDKVQIGTLSEPHLNIAIQRTLSKDVISITLLIFSVFICYILYMVRNISAVIYMGVLILLCVLSGFFVFSILHLEINVISMISLPIILILVLSDSLHLIAGTNKFYEIEDNDERAKRIFSHYLIPSFYSSATTSVAFLSFYFFGESEFVREFGLVTSIGLMLEFIITYTVSPFLLYKMRTLSLHDIHLLKFNSFLKKYRRSITVFMGIASLVSFFLIPQIRIDSTPDSYFPKNDELTERYEYFKDNYFSPININVLVRNSGVVSDSTRLRTLERAKELTKEIRKVSHVTAVISSADDFFFKSKFGFTVNLFSHLGNLNPYYNFDSDTYLLDVRVDELNNTEDVIKQLKSYKSDSSIDVVIASKELMYNQMNRAITVSLLKSLVTSGLGIFLIFMLLIRSVKLAMLSLLPNVVPISVTLLVFYFADFELNMVTSLTLVISLGLLDDDTVHIIYRRLILKEPMQEMNFSVISSALLLVLSFLFFTVSKIEPVQIFGIICAVIFFVGIFSELVIFRWIIDSYFEQSTKDSV